MSRARRHRRPSRGPSRQALRAELRDVERRGEAIDLEVELSYAAGLLASAAALAWFLYEYTRTTGFETISLMALAVVWCSIVEVFALGLVLYLLYRGAWMATCLYTRNDPRRWSARDPEVQEFRGAIQALDRRCRGTFHGAFHFLYRAISGGVVVTALYLALSDHGPVLETLGVVIFNLWLLVQVAGLAAALPTAPTRRLRRWLDRRKEQGLRRLGIWWVSPPGDALPGVGKLEWLLGMAAVLTCFMVNIELVIVPEFEAGQAVYVKGEDTVAALHFRQGGVRGDLRSRVDWTVHTRLRPEPRFHRLDLNHFVATVPLADLEPGVHRVRAALRIRQSRDLVEKGATFMLETEPVEAAFVVVDPDAAPLAPSAP